MDSKYSMHGLLRAALFLARMCFPAIIVLLLAVSAFAKTFPDSSILNRTQLYWGSESAWYLDVDGVRLPRTEGVSGGASGSLTPGKITGKIATDDWLPLPDGASMGSMLGMLHQRFLELCQKLADACRVSDTSTLFDYAPGTSTDNFTILLMRGSR